MPTPLIWSSKQTYDHQLETHIDYQMASWSLDWNIDCNISQILGVPGLLKGVAGVALCGLWASPGSNLRATWRLLGSMSALRAAQFWDLGMCGWRMIVFS